MDLSDSIGDDEVKNIFFLLVRKVPLDAVRIFYLFINFFNEKLYITILKNFEYAVDVVLKYKINKFHNY